MSAWRTLFRIFWALKWPLLAELLVVIFWMVVLENAVGLIQREVFDQLTGEALVAQVVGEGGVYGYQVRPLAGDGVSLNIRSNHQYLARL